VDIERLLADPVIKAYEKGIDRSLVRENLRLSIQERLQNAQQLANAIEQLRDAGRVARRRK
jgi:hypothetical protein